MHRSGSTKEELVVYAILCVGHHLNDGGSKLYVVRICIEAGSEECDKVLAACNLAVDEEAFNVCLNLVDILL